MKKLVAAIILLASLEMSGCGRKEPPTVGAGETGGKPPVAVELANVVPMDLSRAIEVVGALSPKFEATVRAEIKTRVAEVYVTQLVAVAHGQPLLRSDTTDLETALAGARANFAAAKSQEEAARSQGRIALAQVETLKAQVEAAQAQEVEAQVGLVRAERELKRVANLMESGLTTRQSLDEAGSARDAAAARVQTVRATIRAAESQVGSANAQVAAANAQAAAAQAQVAAAGEEIKRVESGISKAVIKAPMRGIVADRFVNVGDLPGDGPVFKIVDNAVLNLTFNVPMKEQGAVRVGQEIDFTTEALPGETFRGRVMFINPAANPADRSIEVVTEVPNPDGRLKGGFFAKGRIITEELKGALTIPRQALVSRDLSTGASEIFVVDKGVAKKRKIIAVDANSDAVRVVSGLGVGEQLVLRGGFSLKEGDRVEVAAGGAK